MSRIRRILFASDLSKASAKAFATAVTLAKAHHATLTIIHVVTSESPLPPEQYGRIETIQPLPRLFLHTIEARGDTSRVGLHATTARSGQARSHHEESEDHIISDGRGDR